MKSRFLKGFFLGAAIGGILTWLFTTEKGRETRQKIAGKAEELKDEIADKIGEIREKMKDGNADSEEVKA